MRKGYYTLQLVNQENGLVYQEHVAGNNDNDLMSTMTYAEVQKPDASYFVRLLSISPDDVLVDLEIDSQIVERRRRLKSGIVYRLGRLQKKRNIHQARVFDSSILDHHEKTGTIKAHFYNVNQAESEASMMSKSYPPICYDDDDDDDDGFVIVEEKTSDDDFIVVIPSPTKKKESKEISSSSGLITTMTMNYCTTDFLVSQGIVQKPIGHEEEIHQHDLHSNRKLRIDYVVDGKIIDTKQVDTLRVHGCGH